MNTPKPENNPKPEPFNQRPPYTESLNSIYIYEDALGDNTVRPRRPNIPLDYPRPQLPPTDGTSNT